jgi:quercetin dioxygenase-like cupin family protein
MEIAAMPTYAVERFSSSGVVMDALPPTVGGASTQVHVARVAAGGTVGRHPAVRSQAFAIVSGRARVTAADESREVEPGAVVLWQPGEDHQTWALTDLVAVVVETDGTFDLSHHTPLA